MRGQLEVYEDGQRLVEAAAAGIERAAREAIAARGRLTLVLAGGHTPRPLYRRLATAPLEWSRVFFFWGDERAVPPDHPDSNYGMARQELLEPIGARPEQVFRIPAELPPEQAAAAYEATLRSFFELAPGQWPVFDLVLLGLGADGHTASLFPDTPAVAVTDRAVVAQFVPAVGAWRITLTLPVLNAARQVLFLVQGAEKARALRAALAPEPGAEPVPAARVAPASGRLLWLADRAAASLLELAWEATP